MRLRLECGTSKIKYGKLISSMTSNLIKPQKRLISPLESLLRWLICNPGALIILTRAGN